VLVNCVTPQTVCVVKAIIALCFVVIGLCLSAVLFDVVVFTNQCMKAVRHHAILSILAGHLFNPFATGSVVLTRLESQALCWPHWHDGPTTQNYRQGEYATNQQYRLLWFKVA